jgi:choice-of-anchor B domain-containing protein
MRIRLVVAVVMALTLSLLTAMPAFAHHDDGKGNVKLPTAAEKEHEAANSSGAGYARCKRGMAADTYPCDRIDMLSHLWLDDLGLSFANDIWGWTDPKTRRDYALVGGAEGTVFVDISNPRRPDIIGTLPTHSSAGGEFWRDLKVYRNHVYVVSEHDDHGMQVFDLTQLRGVSGDPVTFTETAHYDEFGNAHNLNINTDTGYAYAVGTATCDGGLHMVDISDPDDPEAAGCFSDHGYIHDTQCVVYRGPDREHRGKEICFNSVAAGPFADLRNSVSIVDVTDKAAPQTLSQSEYPDDGYSHQGWLTPDQRYFLHGDELDEATHGINTRTRIWDVRDLDNLELRGAFDNDTTSIDHNIYTEGRWAFASNYTSGLRVYDTRRVSKGTLSESAFFDVYPENDDPTFEGGTWSNYSYFRQRGIVAVNTMDRGLFVMRVRLGGQ